MGVPPARANKAIWRVTRFIQHKSRPAILYIPSKLLSFTVISFLSGMVCACRYVACCRTTSNGGSLRKSRKICIVTKMPVWEYIPRQPILPLENSVVPVLRKSSYDLVYVFSCARTFTSINGSVLCLARVCLLACN